MKNKISQYNMEVEYDKGILLFNSLTSKILPVSYEEHAAIETLMENLTEFQTMYPKLYAAFQNAGFIIDNDFDELAYIKLQNKRKIFTHRNYHLTINPTLDCNLKCWYCSVKYAGVKYDKVRMSDDIIKGLQQHIHYLVTQQKATSLLLDWFGGEPTLFYKEVICEISKYAKELTGKYDTSFSQQITTNASLLDREKIKQMKDFNFIFFQITLDGNEHHHNAIKYFEDHSGSYKKIIENINYIADLIPEASIVLRINYDKQTLKHITDIIPDLSEQSKYHITIDFQRVWQVPCTNKERQLLVEAKEKFKEAGFKSTFWAYTSRRFYRCYADSYNHYAINYDGNIYKCTARDYGEHLKLGTLQPSGLIQWKDAIISKYFEKATFENEMCEKCNKLPLCMGPCIQKNYECRVNRQPLKCLYDQVEYSLDAYIIETAKNRNLI